MKVFPYLVAFCETDVYTAKIDNGKGDVIILKRDKAISNGGCLMLKYASDRYGFNTGTD